MNKSKAKGTAAETAIMKYLENNNVAAVRNPPMGNKDQGDIRIVDFDIIVEVKNCQKMELSEWVKEAKTERTNALSVAGVVWHKKRGTTDPGEWYVTMTGDQFLELIYHLDTT